MHRRAERASTMSDQSELTLLINSRFPIVVIETHEEPRALALLEKVCNLESQALFVWSVASGLRRQGRNESVPQTSNPGDCLRHIDRTPQNGVYVLLDFHPFLDDTIHQRLIREIGLAYNKSARTLVFVSPRLELPDPLARMSARFKLALLEPQGVRDIIREEVDLWRNEQGSGEPLRGQREAVELLAQHLAGMTVDDAPIGAPGGPRRLTPHARGRDARAQVQASIAGGRLTALARARHGAIC
jgi:hypothetical protein